ncbi:hypothetical protein ACFRJ1_07065 [Streptomyces sp. NPDC056773]|uniref:hypothetical protein n=1 Tax=unclassified Streptomyces TaxID=2593676 RepID=UPI0036A51964
MSSPLTKYQPFPDPPALIAEYLAKRSTEETALDGPEPWDIGALTKELLKPMPAWLDAVARWLNETYAWQPQHVIPPCWAEHHQLGYEIAAFAFARADAHYDSPKATVLWHEQYDRFLTRMNNALGKAGDECRTGRHDLRPARFLLGAWPDPKPSGDDTAVGADGKEAV